jgi:hypothetical protein
MVRRHYKTRPSVCYNLLNSHDVRAYVAARPSPEGRVIFARYLLRLRLSHHARHGLACEIITMEDSLADWTLLYKVGWTNIKEAPGAARSMLE